MKKFQDLGPAMGLSSIIDREKLERDPPSPEEVKKLISCLPGLFQKDEYVPFGGTIVLAKFRSFLRSVGVSEYAWHAFSEETQKMYERTFEDVTLFTLENSPLLP